MAQPSHEPDIAIVRQSGSLRVVPIYQQWRLDHIFFSQTSSVLTWYHPLSRSASLAAHGAYGAVSSGDTVLRGLTDVQLTGTYYVEDIDLVLSLGVGVPSGTTGLTFDQFVLSARLANNVFRPNVPHFGTGLSVTPSVVWGIPVSEQLVLGLGAMFHYRGAFSPLVNFDDYDPGDELSLTAGADVQLGETGSIAADVVVSLFGDDRVGGREIFVSGMRARATLGYQRFFEMDELNLLLSFRSKAKGDIAAGNLVLPLRDRIEPNQAELNASYTAHFSKRVIMQFLIEGRFFQETSALWTGFDMVGIGVVPEFRLSENFSVPMRLRYLYGHSDRDGNLSGLDAGIGFAVQY